MSREIPLYTLAGMTDAKVTTHPFETEDKLDLSMLRFKIAASNDVVMIIHGLTTSSDMFIMPEHENLVQWLHRQGMTDVFTLDFRMSNRHSYNLSQHRYSMDDAALFDHPAAVHKIREIAGEDVRIHVICHCLGSMSFVMSLFARQLDVTSVISKSVALTPRRLRPIHGSRSEREVHVSLYQTAFSAAFHGTKAKVPRVPCATAR